MKGVRPFVRIRFKDFTARDWPLQEYEDPSKLRRLAFIELGRKKVREIKSLAECFEDDFESLLKELE
jgi:hypothetical protein